MVRFAVAEHGHATVEEAWDEFTAFQDLPWDPETPHMQAFMPWFLHLWTPDPEDTGVPLSERQRFPISADYALHKGRRLGSLAVRYLAAAREAPYSFFDVLTVRPTIGFSLRDILTGREFQTYEQSLSHHVAPGDIMFASLVTVEGVTTIEGCTGVVIPPSYKARIIDLRRWMRTGRRKITAERLRGCDLEMIDVYLDIVGGILHPTLVVHNTDGDELVFHRLTYGVTSPRTAFDALAPLALDRTPDDLLVEAEFDAAGALTKATVPWLKSGNTKHRSWENTILGNIHIDGRTLVAEVNSAERAAALRSILDSMTGAGIEYRETDVATVDEMRARTPPVRNSADQDEGAADVAAFEASPEGQHMMAEMLRHHYHDWPQTPLPALGGKTPLQSVRSRDGREIVESLLCEMERRSPTMGLKPGDAIWAELRQTLFGAATPV
ncbi:MAG TPA: hypothetical protein VH661_02715 [Candidatus Dormibacteraeota bacterium]|jgi:hypothetical protein|nr:hypothetical protein [Candidatus Dormibacteraeota bacterium]